jgi:fatty acid desaturase
MSQVAVPPTDADNLADLPEFSVSLERYPRKHVAAEIRELSQVNGWRTTGLIVFHWSIILLAGWGAIASGHWAAYLAAIVVIATRQQALGVMLHDAAHYLLYKNRTVNDVVSDLLIAFPLAMSTDLYRATHFRHHRFTNTADDPDLRHQRNDRDWFDWPKTRAGCAWVLVKSVFGLNIHKAREAYATWSPWMNLFRPLDGKPYYPLRARVLLVISTVVFYAAIVGLGIIVPAIVLWAVPLLTIMNLFNRLRATAEHIGAPWTHELNSTRTIIPSWLERMTIAPMFVSYHLEHHLFPSVPGPNLGKLHNLLMQDEEFRSQAHITRSYAGLFRELMTPRSGGEVAKPFQLR